MFPTRSLPSLATTFATTLCAAAALAADAPPAFDIANLDPKTKPADDFNRYANGGWLDRNPIPADLVSWGSFDELRDRNQKALRDICEAAAKDPKAPKGSALQKIGDFYASGMDEAQIESAGAKPLEGELARIAAIKDRAELASAFGRLRACGTDVGFSLHGDQDPKDSTQVIAHLGQAGLGLPDRDYYLKDDEDSKKLRAGYLAHVAKLFELLGDKPDAAAATAAKVVALETELAKGSSTRVQRRDREANYHKLTVAEAQALMPEVELPKFLDGVQLAAPAVINVGQPEFVKTLNRLVKEAPLEDWKSYFRWQVVHQAAPYLSSAFVNADFAFYGQMVGGAKELQPRWKRVVQVVDGGIGELLGEQYVAKNFPPEAKRRVLVMVENLRAALKERIQKLEWMSASTKEAALVKLAAFHVKMGYPDKWRDYSALAIDRTSYAVNALQARAFEVKRSLGKIGQPVDRGEWGMTPPTVNAYYRSTLNEIVFPAGILQPPFFSFTADDAINYGGIGAVIGHEMTHGFDDQGRKSDAAGNLRDWWTAEDAKAFGERAKLVVDQFSAYTVLDGLHLNGELTQGENIADLGGLKIAYAALTKALAATPGAAEKKIDGFSPGQRFFLGYAQLWRRNMRPEAMRLQVKTNPHSPTAFRVIGPLSNLPEFAAAFEIPAGAPMARAKEQQAQIW